MSNNSIFALMPKAVADIKAVGKDHRNDHQKYRYKSIDDFMAALNPVLSKYGITLVPQFKHHRLEQLVKGVRATCTLRLSWFAPDGSCITTVHLGEGVDFGDKATNKAMAAALKYAILQTLCVPTEERKDSEADASVNPTVAGDLVVDWAAKFTRCRSLDKLQQLGAQAAEYFDANEIGPADEQRKKALAAYQRKEEMLK